MIGQYYSIVVKLRNIFKIDDLSKKLENLVKNYSEIFLSELGTIKGIKKGAIGICADYKRIVNPVIKNATYPQPTPEELFSKLQGDERFPKLI